MSLFGKHSQQYWPWVVILRIESAWLRNWHTGVTLSMVVIMWSYREKQKIHVNCATMVGMWLRHLPSQNYCWNNLLGPATLNTEFFLRLEIFAGLSFSTELGRKSRSWPCKTAMFLWLSHVDGPAPRTTCACVAKAQRSSGAMKASPAFLFPWLQRTESHTLDRM